MKKIIAWALRILHIRLSDEKLETFAQFVGFCIVGVSNTLISFAVYSVLLWLIPFFREGQNYVLANVIAFFVSVTNSFFWNHRLVFREKSGERRNLFWTYLKTVAAYAGTGLILSNVLLTLAVEKLGWNEYLSNLGIIVIMIPVNFLLNKLWAFRTKPRDGDQSQTEKESNP